ncbi:hypothetical protein V8F33_001709 [Rhypophila sp. PSN 637]
MTTNKAHEENSQSGWTQGPDDSRRKRIESTVSTGPVHRYTVTTAQIVSYIVGECAALELSLDAVVQKQSISLNRLLDHFQWLKQSGRPIACKYADPIHCLWEHAWTQPVNHLSLFSRSLGSFHVHVSESVSRPWIAIISTSVSASFVSGWTWRSRTPREADRVESKMGLSDGSWRADQETKNSHPSSQRGALAKIDGKHSQQRQRRRLRRKSLYSKTPHRG